MEFVSGAALPPAPFLGRFLPPLAEGIAARYLARYSQPGDLIFDPFGQSPQVAFEALRLGRRVVAAGHNPVSRLALSLALRPPTEAELRSALTRLADAPKDGGRLETYLKGLYRARCAACGAEVGGTSHEIAVHQLTARLKFLVSAPLCGAGGKDFHALTRELVVTQATLRASLGNPLLYELRRCGDGMGH